MKMLVQGTAATALAGLYGALAVQGKPVTALKEQRICVVGAGSAGMGVVQMIAQGMRKHVRLIPLSLLSSSCLHCAAARALL